MPVSEGPQCGNPSHPFTSQGRSAGICREICYPGSGRRRVPLGSTTSPYFKTGGVE